MRYLLTLLVFAQSISMAYAQVGLGLRGGLGLSTMTGTDVCPSCKLVPKPGALVGLFGEFRLVDKESFALYLQPEFRFEQKGIRASVAAASGTYHIETDFDYLALPVDLKLAFGSGKLRGTLSIGAYVALLVDVYTMSDGERYDFSDAQRETWHNVDAGIKIGGGLEYRLGPGVLFGEINYAQGLLNPFPDNIGATYDTQLHVAPSITLGYVFRFGRGNDRRAAAVTQPAPTAQVPVAKPEPEPVQPPQPSQPAQQAEAQELRVVSAPRSNESSTSSEFSELIKINKHLDAIADHSSEKTARTVSATEVLSRFSGPDALVIILKDGVQVDYYSISEFLKYIELNHYRYKITDRKLDANGLTSEVRMHRVDAP